MLCQKKSEITGKYWRSPRSEGTLVSAHLKFKMSAHPVGPSVSAFAELMSFSSCPSSLIFAPDTLILAQDLVSPDNYCVISNCRIAKVQIVGYMEEMIKMSMICLSITPFCLL